MATAVPSNCSSQHTSVELGARPGLSIQISQAAALAVYESAEAARLKAARLKIITISLSATPEGVAYSSSNQTSLACVCLDTFCSISGQRQ